MDAGKQQQIGVRTGTQERGRRDGQAEGDGGGRAGGQTDTDTGGGARTDKRPDEGEDRRADKRTADALENTAGCEGTHTKRQVRGGQVSTGPWDVPHMETRAADGVGTGGRQGGTGERTRDPRTAQTAVGDDSRDGRTGSDGGRSTARQPSGAPTQAVADTRDLDTFGKRKLNDPKEATPLSSKRTLTEVGREIGREVGRTVGREIVCELQAEIQLTAQCAIAMERVIRKVVSGEGSSMDDLTPAKRTVEPDDGDMLHGHGVKKKRCDGDG